MDTLEKAIKVIEKQIEKIESKDFDLEAWKIFTINILERLFGSDSNKIQLINELKYDFSSWSLRDTSGAAGSIKKKARVILESSINELETFGLPEKDKKKNESTIEILLGIFENELKGSQFKKLKEILKLHNNKEKAIKLLFEELEIDSRLNMLVNIAKTIE